MRVKDGFKRIIRFLSRWDYRHYICGGITLFVVLLWLCFPNTLGRVIESFRDFGTSIAYYFYECLGIEHGVTPTVTQAAKKPFFDFVRPSASPSFFFPSTWLEFKTDWSAYWRLWASKGNFFRYMRLLTGILSTLSRVLVFVIPFILLLFYWLRGYLRKENNDDDQDSRPLRIHKWITFNVYLPARLWISGFFRFIREHSAYWKAWVWLFAFYFNVVTIFVEFIAFYLYFCVSFDIANVFMQVYKLFFDLWVVIDFIPLWGWCVVGYCIFDRIRKNIGYDTLDHFERRDCGFTAARPIVSMIVATMGKGKTTMMTSEGLSSVVMQRDKAFEKILENDLKFPYFPWINFERSLKRAIELHLVYNLATARRFVRTRAAYFDRHPSRRNCFGYDYEHYGFTYNDKLKVVTVWEVLEIYAQLYFIYVIQSAALLANYSVRVDTILSDLGNFPLWNSDFFKRDSRLIDSFSRHAKILDFDSLRLGFKLGTDRKYADSFEFGTILITEIGKERGNKVELADKKKDSFSTNQKNDGFNAWLKMVRHSATVDGYPFVRVITDEQRPESWGADARDLCEIIHIRDKGETHLAMPFFALTELVYAWVFNKFAGLYYQYRHVRSDNTLIMHLLKSFTAKVQHYYTGIYNTFGYHVLSVQVERGTQDGEMQDCKYYIMNKKVYSKRFSTDCFSDYFSTKALRSQFGIDDLPEYQTERATFDELYRQNSFFINDLLSGLEDE